MIVPDGFLRPYVLLCEGKGDVKFFIRLFQARNIGQNFTICCPNESPGRSGFGRTLRSISANEAFITNVNAVLVVADNDDDLAISFQEVKNEISAAKDFAIPDSERTVVKSKGRFSTAIYMLPHGSKGNLELLCLESAYSKWPIKAHLDTFVENCPAKDWSIGKQAKMRMQTILAANNKKQPDAGFASSWTQDEKYQIPVDHNCFDDVASFIRDFHLLTAA